MEEPGVLILCDYCTYLKRAGHTQREHSHMMIGASNDVSAD